MTRDEALAYAARWIETWNRKDVEGILAHFAEQTRFTSARAAATVGVATVVGKAALRDYWNRAVARIETIRFTLDHVVWDPDSQELLVVYEAVINGQGSRAGELMRFDASGQVVEGEGLYGAAL
ncbi:MAG: nuclear transport factor 2 family protein [Dehalococcoidia bacterium]